MSEKFDVAKWHQKALEDSRLEGQLFRSVPASSYEELFDRIASLEAEVEALKAERRWIPVSEKPTKSDWYLIMYQGYRVPDAGYYDVEAGWLSDVPDYWMPLPEPPEVK